MSTQRTDVEEKIITIRGLLGSTLFIRNKKEEIDARLEQKLSEYGI